MKGDIHMRNISCPVSPIGSPLQNSRSSRHINGRMSPSHISSPQTLSGASTPLTGGSGALPFNQSKQSSYPHDGLPMLRTTNDPFACCGPAFHAAKCDRFQRVFQSLPSLQERATPEPDKLGLQFGNHMSHHILRDHVKLRPSLNHNPRFPNRGRIRGV
ncbi:hypothetical protein HPP92_008298 [Vanilla planifolia]|uniref:Uncharacterized protein n=1 Tax=Vanilla planifolia TaxID=51239 RepID=A0A835V689_VANPL|nr:hypothetical protein HPP92_008298 [Vanilla planifolia]